MRILLAVDHSECSAAAVKAVIAQFTPQHLEVLVLHADEWPKGLSPSMAFAEGPAAAQSVLSVHEERRRAAEALVAATAAQLRAAGFTTTCSVRDGDPRELIPACAEDWQADLVVLGSHGRKGLDRLILGSVSDTVARHARCSVEIVRAAAPSAAQSGGDAPPETVDGLESQLRSGMGMLDWRRLDGSVNAETVRQRALAVEP